MIIYNLTWEQQGSLYRSYASESEDVSEFIGLHNDLLSIARLIPFNCVYIEMQNITLGFITFFTAPYH